MMMNGYDDLTELEAELQRIRDEYEAEDDANKYYRIRARTTYVLAD
jgi:uncharacterized protein YxjI